MQQSLKGDDMNIIATRTKSPDTPPSPPSSPPLSPPPSSPSLSPPPSSPSLSPPLQTLNNNRFRC